MHRLLVRCGAVHARAQAEPEPWEQQQEPPPVVEGEDYVREQVEEQLALDEALARRVAGLDDDEDTVSHAPRGTTSSGTTVPSADASHVQPGVAHYLGTRPISHVCRGGVTYYSPV